MKPLLIISMLYEQLKNFLLSLCDRSQHTNPFVMMGVLVIKHIIENLSKDTKVGHSCHCRRCINGFTLVARQSASVINVSVAPMYGSKHLKEE